MLTSTIKIKTKLCHNPASVKPPCCDVTLVNMRGYFISTDQLIDFGFTQTMEQ